MKTSKKNDNFSKILFVVAILHVVFLLIMPGLKKIVIEKEKVNKIAIGINNYTEKQAPKKIKVKKPAKKIEKPKPKVEPPKKVEKPKPKVEKPKKILKTTQSVDDMELMAVEDANRRVPNTKKVKDEKLPKIEDKKEIQELNEVEDVAIDPIAVEEPKLGDIPIEDVKIDDTDDDKVEDVKWNDLLGEDKPDIIGPKSGLKVGSVDGKSRVIWDPSNQDPKYPLEAEKQAQTADVKIILDVDASGKVINVKLIKTGVDVIDRAVEGIARSWNVKLVNNGTAISGKVMVEYKFKLKAGDE